MDDPDDPDLGAVAMDDAVGGAGGEVGGPELTAGFGDWPDDDETEAVPHREPAADRQGAGPSTAPAARGGAHKRRAGPGLFGSRPKKPRGSAAATKRDEAAAKAARFRKVVKQPRAVST